MTTSPADESARPTALRIRALRLTYPGRRRQPARRALDGIDLTIERGCSTALLGPNGSGKSSLFRCVCGLLAPDEGTIEIVGERDLRRARSALGVVFQSPGLDADMTVFENLRDHLLLYGFTGRSARRRVDEALERGGLRAHRDHLVKTLSGGWARRVDLCRALLHEPDVLLLDEPTVGLDPSARKQFLAMLEQERAGGLTVLMSTHLTDEADGMDRVILLHEGRVVADDAPAVLRDRLGAMQLTIHDRRWEPDAASRPAWTRGPRGWTLRGDRTERLEHVTAGLASGGVPFSVAPPTLADVFEARTGVAFDGEEPADDGGTS